MEKLAKRAPQSNIFFSPKGATTASSNNIDYSTDEVYSIGSDIEFQWAIDQTSYQFLLYQQVLSFVGAKTGPVIYVSSVNNDDPPNSTEVQNFHWTTQLYDFDLKDSNVFFLWARSDGKMLFTSDYFNVSNAQPTTSSTYLTSSSYPTSSSMSSVSTHAQLPSDTPRTLQSPVDTHEDSRDNSTKIGIGAGAGVGASVLVGICILVGYLLARKRRTAKDGHSDAQQSPPKYESASTVAYVQHYRPPIYPSRYNADLRDSCAPEPGELPSRCSAVELPSGRF